MLLRSHGCIEFAALLQIQNRKASSLLRARCPLRRLSDLPRYAMVVVGAFSILSACSRSDVASQRSGMGSPMSMNPAPLKVQLGNVQLNVPENCFDSPLEVQGNNGAYIVSRDILLVALLPKVKCRAPENLSDFSIVGENRPDVTILVSSVGRETASKEVLEKNLLSVSTGDSRLIKGSLKRGLYDGAPVTSVALRGASQSSLEWRDIFEDFKRPGFIYCSRSRPDESHSGRPFVGNCRHEFSFGELIVFVSYGRGWLPQRDKIRSEVENKLKSFRKKES